MTNLTSDTRTTIRCVSTSVGTDEGDKTFSSHVAADAYVNGIAASLREVGWPADYKLTYSLAKGGWIDPYGELIYAEIEG
jgi:hypothetical protein